MALHGRHAPYTYTLPFAFQTNAGDPTGALVPAATNALCIDTTNSNLYIAAGPLAADWKLFTRAA